MDKSGFLSVAKDFTQFPAGRSINDGPRSGELFCDEFLLPALKASTFLTVRLDGTMGYGSSFLEGAFARLVVIHGFSSESLRQRLVFESSDSSITMEIWGYIEGNRPSPVYRGRP